MNRERKWKLWQDKNKKNDFKNVTKRYLRKIKSGLIINKIFEESGFVNVYRAKRLRILRKMAKDMKLTKLPPLSEHHKKKYESLVKKYMKIISQL